LELMDEDRQELETIFFPVDIKRTLTRLLRKNLVRKEVSEGRERIVLTGEGKKQALKYKLADLRPKTGKWDGKWRMVFFDIDDEHRKKRDELRKLLARLGFQRYQESVYVSRFDCDAEVNQIREILELTGNVRLAIAERLEGVEEILI